MKAGHFGFAAYGFVRELRYIVPVNGNRPMLIYLVFPALRQFADVTHAQREREINDGVESCADRFLCFGAHFLPLFR